MTGVPGPIGKSTGNGVATRACTLLRPGAFVRAREVRRAG